ncbi:MAG: 1-deoxy-D-xylulose-5-phosphate reductoisomerase [Syntrophomonadaceae bacterium]|jgi:1-deoxy-D-xylulose-5-phosphate reductoisomerase|nr:1-deoxy-D-xylulose-5-phosphate reductoisomerase [Syntrophomonadaceae bacterium]
MNSDQKIKVVILGSTGSIGRQALEVIDLHADKFQVTGLAARDEWEELLEQIDRYRPAAAAVNDGEAYKHLREGTAGKLKLFNGVEGLSELAALEEADLVLIALSGAVGILPTMAAIRAGKKIALANKETLVAAGEIVMETAAAYNIDIIPVDSEHSAIFQCLGVSPQAVKNIWLTASGGPFIDFSQEQLQKVSVKEALKHPNWKMGPKITIDSATMMNKGLEVIEAHHLFQTSYQQIKVVLQPESIIHSMVEFIDGSFLAHLGVADMRIPIQYAFSYPLRYNSPAAHLNPLELSRITFVPPDHKRFPSLELAYHAGKTGGTLPAVMNAANEVAVNSFLNGQIGFASIPVIVEKTMNKHENMEARSLENILMADQWARNFTEDLITREVK